MHSILTYIVLNLNPIALQVGNLSVRWYGLGYVLAISLATWAVLRYADALGVPRDHVWNLFIWTVIAGLVGGRLYYVIQQPDLLDHYIKQPVNIIAVWNGGMAFFGAIFVAAPTAATLAYRAGLSPWITLDIAAIFAAVGQMFGRLGNIINGDIVGYGTGTPSIPGSVCLHPGCIAYVSDPHFLPWSTVYLNPGAFSPLGVAYQPAALYEILFNLFVLACLWPLRLILPRNVRAGAFFCLYVAFYSIGQYIIFFFRANDFVTFFGIHSLKQAQWTAIFTLIGISIFYAVIVQRFGQPWSFGPHHKAPPPRTTMTAEGRN